MLTTKLRQTILFVLLSFSFHSFVYAQENMAAQFSGATQNIDLGDDAVQLAGNFTIMCWIKSENTASWVMAIGDHSSGSHSQRAPWFSINDNQHIEFGFGAGIRVYNNSARNVVIPNKWQHVAMTYNKQKLILYVDGNEVSNILVYELPVSKVRYIGGCCNEFFKGKIDEVSFWGKTFTPTEIKANMKKLYTGTEANLLAYFPFENNTKNAVSNNVAVNNGATFVVNDAFVPAKFSNAFIFQKGNIKATNNEKDVFLAGVGVNMTAGFSTKKINNVKLALSGTLPLSNIKALKIYSFGNDINGEKTLVKTITNLQPTIDIATDIELLPEKNFIEIAVDFADDLTIGQTLDAQLVSLTLSDSQTYTPNNIDADGEITTSDELMNHVVSFSEDENSYIDFGEDAVILGNQFTVEFDVFPSNSSHSWRGILGNPADVNINRSLSIYVYQHTKLEIGFGTDPWMPITTPDVLAENEWNHVAVSFDGTDLKLYINGELKLTDNRYATKTPPQTPLRYLGKTDVPFGGKVDELRVWDVARSGDEIKNNVKKRLTGSEIGLIGYWNFDSESNPIPNLSKNNNDGYWYDIKFEKRNKNTTRPVIKSFQIDKEKAENGFVEFSVVTNIGTNLKWAILNEKENVSAADFMETNYAIQGSVIVSVGEDTIKVAPNQLANGTYKIYLMAQNGEFKSELVESATINVTNGLPEWNSLSVVQLNRIDRHAFLMPYNTLEEFKTLERKQSPNYKLINGSWKFKYAKRPADRPIGFEATDYDISDWADIPVPSNMERQGYGFPVYLNAAYAFPKNQPFVPTEWNPVGSYKRTFTVPTAWDGRSVILHVGSMNSAGYVWINGQFVGYSEDTKTEAEWDVTPYLQAGENQIAIQVYRFSNGSYLECQDFWRMSGIQRDVYLYATPKTHIRDFFIRADLDETYTYGLLNVDVELEDRNQTPSNGSYQIEVQLLTLEGEVVQSQTKTVNYVVGENNLIPFSLNIPNPKKWSAEQPNLYKTAILLKDNSDNVIEVVGAKTGFRNIKIENSQFLVNGQPVLIKGVNRHETHQELGQIATEEAMKKDIQLMKEGNINAVRLSHYPNDERWYELCAEYGIYMVDEANIESHGYGYGAASLAKDEKWNEAHLFRIKNMVERSKNCPAVVTWSMGNEAGNGINFYNAYAWMKNRDKTRPVQYERAEFNWNTDIICPQYPSPDALENYGKSNHTKPYISSEYAHAMGNSMGNFKEYWDIIEQYDKLQGGFIWDWVDQSYLEKDANGTNYWKWGGDYEPDNFFSNLGVGSDGNFLNNGIISPDRNPQPEYYEVKKVYQHIKFKAKNIKKGNFQIQNKYFFTNLNQFNFVWEVRAKGKTILSGTINRPNVQPQQDYDFNIDLSNIKSEQDAEYFIIFKAKTAENWGIVKSGTELANEQFALPISNGTPHKAYFGDMGNVNYNTNSKQYIVTGNNFKIIFDRVKLNITSYELNGEKLLVGGDANFWRATTDNEFGYRDQYTIWRTATDNKSNKRTTITQVSDKELKVTYRYDLNYDLGSYETNYTIYGNGEIKVENQYRNAGYNWSIIPRIGMKFTMSSGYENVVYYGRGPNENYWDRKSGSFVDEYKTTVNNMFFPYPTVQENGNRCDVRWFTLTNETGKGLLVSGEKTIDFSALHYTQEDMGPTQNTFAKKHLNELHKSDKVFLNIDYRQTGVAGINSWGERPLAEYTLYPQDYSYSFKISPFEKNDNPHEVSNRVYEEGTDVAHEKYEQLNVYPNPVKDVLKISLPNNQTDFMLTIYTLDGQIVLKKSIKPSNDYSLNVQELKSGFYFVVLSNKENKRFIGKIVKE